MTILEEQTARYPFSAHNRAATQAPPVTRRSSGQRPEDTARTTAEDEDIYPQRPPSSVRRYRPSGTQEATRRAPRPQRRSKSFTPLLIGCSLCAGILIATFVPPLWQQASDQVHYGYPRTFQTDANVGHGPQKYPDSHFIALNNHGYIEVIEIPEGAPVQGATIRIYPIVQSGTANADLSPVTLTFEDINGNGKPDMLVHCNNNTYILYNDGSSFKTTP